MLAVFHENWLVVYINAIRYGDICVLYLFIFVLIHCPNSHALKFVCWWFLALHFIPVLFEGASDSKVSIQTTWTCNFWHEMKHFVRQASREVVEQAKNPHQKTQQLRATKPPVLLRQKRCRISWDFFFVEPFGLGRFFFFFFSGKVSGKRSSNITCDIFDGSPIHRKFISHIALA